MSEREMKHQVLEWFYQRRDERGMAGPEPGDFDPPVPASAISRICEELDQQGTIRWTGLMGPPGSVVGCGQITSPGITEYEDGLYGGPAPVLVPVVQSIHISNSQGIQVGNYNTQNFVSAIEQLIQQINNANVTTQEREEAKSRLRGFLEHPLVSAIVGGTVEGLLTLL